MDILITLNKAYMRQLEVLIHSLLLSNEHTHFVLYIISKELTQEDIDKLEKRINNKLVTFKLLFFDDSLLIGAPTSSRYPLEIYYRLFAAKVLPEEIKRILYLDPDIVVINRLDELYNTNFENAYFIGATHVRNFLRRINKLRVKAKKNSPYINTGVMMMNIELLRKEQNVQEVYDFINKFKLVLSLPDQDIIFGLYGEKIKLVDFMIYNLSDRMLTRENLIFKKKYDLDWVKENTVIIHYCGRNKPWRSKYRGILNIFYNKIEERMELMIRK